MSPDRERKPRVDRSTGASQLQAVSINIRPMSLHRFFSSFTRLCTTWPAGLFAGAAALAVPTGSAAAACVGPSAPGERIAVADVNGYGEILTADGRTLRLAGVVLPDEAAAGAEIRRHVASGAYPVALADRPDRWGRYEAQLAVGTAAGAVSLAEPLVAAGLALLRPDAVASTPSAISEACASRLAEVEDAARLAGRGVWAGGGPGRAAAMPLPADDGRLLKQYEGRFVIVAGKVTSVGERRAMTFLNFGPEWRRDFSVMIARGDWEKMARDGLSAAALEGRRVMVRGDLMLRDTARGDGREAGGAPVIRLSVARGLSFLDLD